ncbi:WD40-repeat-containing domain protein [Amylostereum chailletii]|nr:WD40-repeat-containing domain protein [Amylostereum chailletii]
MLLQETVLCATAPTSLQQGGPGSITLHDIQTGSSLASFKQTSASIHCTAIVPTVDGQGGVLLATQPDKSILNVYNFQKDQIALKIVLPERLVCLAIDSRGLFCAGGTVQGRIYLWEIASGILYNSWEAHYRKVTVLRFTRDGEALVSGSEDSGVSVWSLSRLIDEDAQLEVPMAYASLSDHTLPVTDIACGVGPFPSCRILTSSVDHSVKLWDLSTKSLLTTFQFPHAIDCLTWDVTERVFFAATAEGSIHQVNLFRRRVDKHGGVLAEAVGGAGVTDIIRIGDEDPKESTKRLLNVGEPISTLTLSLTSSLLLVGTTTGVIHLYDVPSHQLLRTITSHKGSRITHLETLLKPPDLVGHVSLSLTAGVDRDAIPVRPVVAFQRMREAKAREAHEIAMLLPVQKKPTPDTITTYSDEEISQDYAFFIQPSATDTVGAASLQSRVTELEDEVTRLRTQLSHAKGVNDVMWETVVHKMVAGQDTPVQSDVVVNGEGNDTRARKRGRTQE